MSSTNFKYTGTEEQKVVISKDWHLVYVTSPFNWTLDNKTKTIFDSNPKFCKWVNNEALWYFLTVFNPWITQKCSDGHNILPSVNTE